MSLFDDLIASAKNVVDFAEKKTDSVVEYSKLKYQQGQLNATLKSLYERLGSAVYSMVKAEYDNKDLVDSLISEIEEAKEALEVINAKVAEKKQIRLCPVCGAQNAKDALYCMKCGNKFDVFTKEEPCSCGCEAEKEEENGDACCCGEPQSEPEQEASCSCGCEDVKAGEETKSEE